MNISEIIFVAMFFSCIILTLCLLFSMSTCCSSPKEPQNVSIVSTRDEQPNIEDIEEPNRECV